MPKTAKRKKHQNVGIVKSAALSAVDSNSENNLPPILIGQQTPQVAERVEHFYNSIAQIYEAWLNRWSSRHTRRSYDQDVMNLVQRFMEWRWPDDAARLLQIGVPQVQAYRDWLVEQQAAPKTINRRLSSLSSFYKYLGAAAAELRLPIIVPNPAHAQFLPRSASDAIHETQALSPTRARQLLSLPVGDSVLAYRDRAILKFYTYTGARLATGCRLEISDFHVDDRGASIRVAEKGERRRKIGLHFAASQAIMEYIEKANLTSGPLFRPRANSRSRKLGGQTFSMVAMYRLIQSYLVQLPRAVHEVQGPDDGNISKCIYTPHSLRATTATSLLEAGCDITKVQELLGHRHVTTTQIYDKRRRGTHEGASHEVPI